jgi:hypothetical protein
MLPSVRPLTRVQWTGFFLGSTHCAHWEIHMPIVQIMKTIILLKSLTGTRAFWPFWEFWLTLPRLAQILSRQYRPGTIICPKHSITHFSHMQISCIRQSVCQAEKAVCMSTSDNLCKSFGSDITSTRMNPKLYQHQKTRRLEKLENFERCLKWDSVTKGPGPTTTAPSIWNQFWTVLWWTTTQLSEHLANISCKTLLLPSHTA